MRGGARNGPRPSAPRYPAERRGRRSARGRRAPASRRPAPVAADPRSGPSPRRRTVIHRLCPQPCAHRCANPAMAPFGLWTPVPAPLRAAVAGPEPAPGAARPPLSKAESSRQIVGIPGLPEAAAEAGRRRAAPLRHSPRLRSRGDGDRGRTSGSAPRIFGGRGGYPQARGPCGDYRPGLPRGSPGRRRTQTLGRMAASSAGEAAPMVRRARRRPTRAAAPAGAAPGAPPAAGTALRPPSARR